MLKIGLTGGIGSGKTTVAAIFIHLGIPVYFADEASKKLLQEDARIRQSIIEHFGEETYPAGLLDRTYLAKQVFNDPKKLALLNSITHPPTIAHAGEWMKTQSGPYAIKEAALIFESGSDKGLDFVIGVSAPVELRIHRAMERDHATREDILRRMEKQMDETEKMSRCKYVIRNDERELLIPQVLALHESFLSMVQP